MDAEKVKETEKEDDGRIIRKDWAVFCIYHCPHPNKPCKKDPRGRPASGLSGCDTGPMDQKSS